MIPINEHTIFSFVFLCSFQYDDRQLNQQLRFLKQLFNLDAYKNSLNRTKLGKQQTHMISY